MVTHVNFHFCGIFFLVWSGEILEIALLRLFKMSYNIHCFEASFNGVAFDMLNG